MKRILLVALLFLFTSVAFAQSKTDSIEVLRDTINIIGKIIDEQGKPIYNALILSETTDKNHRFIQSRTNKEGFFHLNGISPKNKIRVRTAKHAVEHIINGSRFLLITLSPIAKQKIISDEQHLAVTAKRISTKQKYAFKIKDTLITYGFHPFGHYSQANYPGGLYKFYSFLQKSINYPEKAVKNNIEGIVAIEFIVDTSGHLKDFIVVKDVGFGCSEEVLIALKNSRKWNPAMNGLPVEQRIYIEIPFKLTD